jgi:hypothetical protein
MEELAESKFTSRLGDLPIDGMKKLCNSPLLVLYYYKQDSGVSVVICLVSPQLPLSPICTAFLPLHRLQQPWPRRERPVGWWTTSKTHPLCPLGVRATSRPLSSRASVTEHNSKTERHVTLHKPS